MLIGNAPCSWGINYPTGNRLGWEDDLDQVAAAGYAGTELGPFGFLPTDSARLADELARRGLVLMGATHVHVFSDPRQSDALLATLDRLGRVLTALGARHLVIMDESNAYPTGAEGALSEEGWQSMAALVRTARERVWGEFGLTLSFHPHVLTAVEYEAQIDRLLDDTGIALCFDTGHHAFREQDPLAYMERVFDRIAYMHLKNVDAAIVAEVAAGRIDAARSFDLGAMCPLPDGAVDIPAILGLLLRRGFAGPVVVEQDPAETAAETPQALAARNLAYLKEVMP